MRRFAARCYSGNISALDAGRFAEAVQKLRGKLPSVGLELREGKAKSPGAEYALLARLWSQLDSELFGEVPLTDAASVAERYSEDNLRKQIDVMRQLLRDATVADPLWDAFVSDFPELLPEPLTGTVPGIDPLLEALITNIRAQHAASLAARKDARAAGAAIDSARAVRFGDKLVAEVGQMITLPKDVLTASLPKLAPSKLLKTVVEKSGGDLRVLVRQPVLSLVRELEARLNSGFVGSHEAILLDGNRGSGKSTSLALAVLWARRNGWLVVEFDGEEMVKGGNIVRNVADFRSWDQQLTNKAHCERILAAESDKLSKVPVRCKGQPFPGAEKCQTLADIARHGSKTDDASTAALCWLKKELALVTEFPVLVAIDNFNCLHNASAYYDMDSDRFSPVRLMPSQLTVPRLFMDPYRQPLLNGTTVIATTKEGGKPWKNWQAATKKKPLSKRLEVPHYDKAEFDAVYDDFLTTGIALVKLEKTTKDYVHAVTSGNPGEVFKLTYFV